MTTGPVVIGPTRHVRVFVYREAEAYDSLLALVTGHLRKSITRISIFIGKTRRRAKALYFEGTG